MKFIRIGDALHATLLVEAKEEQRSITSALDRLAKEALALRRLVIVESPEDHQKALALMEELIGKAPKEGTPESRLLQLQVIILSEYESYLTDSEMMQKKGSK